MEVEADDDDGVGVAALVETDTVELGSCVASGPGELVFGVDTVLSVGGRGVLGDDELVCDVDIVVVVVVNDASLVAVVAIAVEAVDVEAVCDDIVVVVVGASVDVVDSPVLVKVGNADVSRTVVGSV